MRIPHLALLACLALAACDHDPTFDASSPEAYQKSLGEITAKLNAEDQRRLQIALLTLALGNTAQSNALQSASPKALNDLVRSPRSPIGCATSTGSGPRSAVEARRK